MNLSLICELPEVKGATLGDDIKTMLQVPDWIMIRTSVRRYRSCEMINIQNFVLDLFTSFGPHVDDL